MMAARTIYFLNDYSMAEARRRWMAGDYPGHHMWGMNAVETMGWDVEFSPSPRPKLMPDVKLPGLNANNRFQLELAAAPPKQRNVYCGSIHIFKLLGLLKSAGLFRRKLIAMVHHPVTPSAVNRRALRSADALFYLNQFAHDRTVAAMPELRGRSHVLGWCVDTAFYDAQIGQAPPSDHKLIVAAGKELRDYESLVRGVAMVDDPELKVEIYCSEETAPTATDPRVTVYKGGRHGSSISYLDLLGRYRDAIAIAIPMKPVDRTVGMTSVFDGFAARRAMMITRHPCIDAPLEAKELGIVVEPNSAKGWAEAIHMVLADPARVIAIGANGRAYAENALSMDDYGKRLDALFKRYFCDDQ